LLVPPPRYGARPPANFSTFARSGSLRNFGNPRTLGAIIPYTISYMNEKYFEKPEVQTGLARPEDIDTILKLQQENLAENVGEQEKNQQGFVSVSTTKEQLEDIAQNEGITVAKVNEKVIGYLMPMTVEHAGGIPLLEPFIEKFKSLKIDSIPLTNLRHCVLGQVCIAKEHRGTGVLEKLYNDLKTRLAEEYDIGISEIGTNNPRSLHAHLDKIGLKIAEQYSADGRDWYIVYLDFRDSKKP